MEPLATAAARSAMEPAATAAAAAAGFDMEPATTDSETEPAAKKKQPQGHGSACSTGVLL